MRSCSDCELTEYCYSDPEVWDFESRARAEEIVQKIRECYEESLAKVSQERGMSTPYSGRENGSTGL